MVQTVEPPALQDWIGKEVPPSPWFQISQERINQFADATLDHQYIHVNEEKALSTPFGGTIAHGFLSLSLIPYLAENTGVVPTNIEMAVNYGLNKVRFLNPVKAGKQVRAHMVLREVAEKGPSQYLLTNEVTIEIEGEKKPALIAESLILYAVA